MNRWKFLEWVGFIVEMMAFFASGYYYAQANLPAFAVYLIFGFVMAIIVGKIIKKNYKGE